MLDEKGEHHVRLIEKCVFHRASPYVGRDDINIIVFGDFARGF